MIYVWIFIASVFAFGCCIGWLSHAWKVEEMTDDKPIV